MKAIQAKPPALQLKQKSSGRHRALRTETDLAARKVLMTDIADQKLRFDLELVAIRMYG